MTKEQVIDQLSKRESVTIEPIGRGYVFQLAWREQEGGYGYTAGKRHHLTDGTPYIEWLFASLSFPTPADVLKELDKSLGEWELPND